MKNNLGDLAKNLTGKSLLFLVISLLALVAIFYFVFLPAAKRFHGISTQIKERKANLTRVQQPPGEYRLLEKETKELGDRKNSLATKLFWEEDISRFLNELTRLTSNSEVEFINIKPEPSLPPSENDKEIFIKYRFARIPISVTIKSSYAGLLDFLKKVEESDKFIKIEYLNIESDRSSFSRHNVNIRFSIITKAESASEKV